MNTSVIIAWEFSTRLYDSKRGRTLPGVSKFTALGRDKLRVDITGPFGFVHVGTLILNDGKIFVHSPMEKKKFVTEATSEAVEQLLKTPLDPYDIFSLLYQSGLSDEDWTCDRASQYSSCQKNIGNVEVQWIGNLMKKKSGMVISHSKGKVTFETKSIRELPMQKAEKLFKIPQI